jgi:hypothetical protein
VESIDAGGNAKLRLLLPHCSLDLKRRIISLRTRLATGAKQHIGHRPRSRVGEALRRDGTRRVFDGTSPRCDLLSVRNGVSVRAGFGLVKGDFHWNEKTDLAVNKPDDGDCFNKSSSKDGITNTGYWQCAVNIALPPELRAVTPVT